MQLNLNLINSLLPKDIRVSNLRSNGPACEEYIETTFSNPDGYAIKTMVPYVYRRSYLDLNSETEIADYLKSIQRYFTRAYVTKWVADENAKLTKDNTYSIFLRILLSSNCKEIWQNKFPQNNNPQKLFQTMKDSGYVIAILRGDATNGNLTRYWILPLPLVNQTKYETMSPTFVKRAISTLGGINVYENRPTKGLLPDHKFSEIRWDENTSEENPDNMPSADIVKKFQLLDAQRNQQKREVCRNCFKTGKRGTIFGINFFYKGTEDWDNSIPTIGKEAEKGCIGCPWYDIALWREELQKKLKNE